LGLIDAREGDLETEPPARLADLEAYAGATGGALGDLAAAFLGGDAVACQMSRDAGTGYALLGLMRALPAHLAQGRHHLPQELMPQAIKGPSPELCRAVARVAERAADYLGRVRVKDVHRKSRAACLCALQAKTHLKRLKRAGFNPFDSRLSIPATRPLALWWGMRR
ncbi:MAG: squalene/phytoene synthase family protein, partial [Alphaproteobacteria bacterium]|nr:squalene/phytoene synthase family protein [Alphaproteobacteria bacterium]